MCRALLRIYRALLRMYTAIWLTSTRKKNLQEVVEVAVIRLEEGQEISTFRSTSETSTLDKHNLF